MSADQFVQYLVSGVTQGSIYALVGLGFTIVYAVTSIINFAQGEFVMLGGMISFVLFDSLGFPIAASCVLSILVGTAVGGVLYALAIRPARRASVVSLIIITIGAAIFIRGVAAELWGVDTVRPPYFTGNNSLHFLGAYIHPQAIWVIGTTVVTTIGLHLFLTHTMMGKALRAAAISKTGAGLVGIDTRTMALISFIMAATIGAIGGVVMAPLTLTSYRSGAMLGLKGFVAASIGGFRSPIAAVAGGFTLGVVESLAVGVDWGPFTSAYKDVISMMVLLMVLLVRSGRLAAEERLS